MAQSIEYTAENWESDLKSVTRRTYINQELNKNQTLDEIKQNVRESEKRHEVVEIIDQLSSKETLEPRIEKMCELIFKDIKIKYPYVKGIVVMGSGAHGGGLVRSLVDSDEDDLDWGVIVTQDKANNMKDLDTEINLMRQQADKLMKSKSNELGFSQKLESCWMFNPEQYFEPELDENLINGLLSGAPEALVFYLQPTIPHELGEKNTKLIAKELNKLRDISEKDYDKIIFLMLREWHEMHNLQGKHFRDFSTDKITRDKILKILMYSRKYMDEDFKNNLD